MMLSMSYVPATKDGRYVLNTLCMQAVVYLELRANTIRIRPPTVLQESDLLVAHKIGDVPLHGTASGGEMSYVLPPDQHGDFA